MLSQSTDKKISGLDWILQFIKRFPIVYNCDERLRSLSAAETIRNVSEAYREKNCANVPTIEELEVYYTNVLEQQLQDLMAKVWITDTQGYNFQDGKLFAIRIDGDGETHQRLVFSAPLTVSQITKRDDEYLITFKWLGTAFTKTVSEFLTFANSNLKLSGASRQHFAEFLFALISQAKDNDLITDDPSPIIVDDDGIIRVNYDVSSIDIKKSMSLLRDFYEWTSNPSALLSAMSFALTGPLHYYIRQMAPADFLVPIHLSDGQTGAGKTSMAALFCVRGYAQDKDSAILSKQRVATRFTFMKALGDSTLPVIINDIGMSWLKQLLEEIKNAREGAIIGSRGKADQTVNDYILKRSLFLTMNETFDPFSDAALNRRFITEHFSDSEVKRQDKKRFRDLENRLTPGFMFGLFSDVFDGRMIGDVVRDITQTDGPDGFVQYGLDRINELCFKHGVPPFPPYRAQNTLKSGGEVEELCQWLVGMWRKINDADDYGRHYNYSGIDRTNLDVDIISIDSDRSTIYVIWFIGSTFQKARKELQLPWANATDMLNNIVPNPVVSVHAKMRNHKFGPDSAKAFALKYVVTENMDGGS